MKGFDLDILMLYQVLQKLGPVSIEAYTSVASRPFVGIF